ncbi:MAG: hypothetical protein GEV10_01940 [Streptosporangiales bacterium]|nr:hypothetical protein [Streptosporangiales bacterium]
MSRIPSATLFLGALAVLFAGYTVLAFGLEWRTHAGRIGPGFFPRIIGCAAFVACAAAALWALRAQRRPAKEKATEDDPSAGDGAGTATDVRTMLLVVAAGVAYVVLLLPLGALLATALFMVTVLWLLDRRHPVRIVVVGLGTPAAAYLLLEVGLSVGLPKGLLPML